MEWISVNKKLPDNDDMVLVCLSKNFNKDNAYVDCAYHNGDIWLERDYNTPIENDIDYWYVTYWMPLPLIPYQDGQVKPDHLTTIRDFRIEN